MVSSIADDSGTEEIVSNREKGESQEGGNKKTKHAKFSEQRTFLTP